MTWKEVEWIFNRALRFTFSRRKLFFTVPILILCGFIFVFCRTVESSSNDWLSLSMTFLPIFLCTPILLGMGIILTRIYHHEVKGLPASYRRTFRLSKELMLEVAYLTMPVILAYLVLWTLLGLFYLLKEIPYIGQGLGVIFSFGPFLLLLCSFALAVLSVSSLFLATPLIALRGTVEKEVLLQMQKRLQYNPFSNFAMLLMAILPVLFVGAFLLLAAVMTGNNYIALQSTMALSLQWFFIMLPFSALLTPAVIFFFNFAAESHVLMLKKMQEEPCTSPS